nr:hypothetical protein HmN_000786000 [Hymenolepis microstoma]
MADLVIRQPFFFPNSILSSQSTMFTSEQLDAIKGVTASRGLFASLISHSQKEQLPMKPLPLSNPYRTSDLSRSCKSYIPSKKTSYSLFRHGARVRLELE